MLKNVVTAAGLSVAILVSSGANSADLEGGRHLPVMPPAASSGPMVAPYEPPYPDVGMDSEVDEVMMADTSDWGGFHVTLFGGWTRVNHGLEAELKTGEGAKGFKYKKEKDYDVWSVGGSAAYWMQQGFLVYGFGVDLRYYPLDEDYEHKTGAGGTTAYASTDNTADSIPEGRRNSTSITEVNLSYEISPRIQVGIDVEGLLAYVHAGGVVSLDADHVKLVYKRAVKSANAQQDTAQGTNIPPTTHTISAEKDELYWGYSWGFGVAMPFLRPSVSLVVEYRYATYGTDIYGKAELERETKSDTTARGTEEAVFAAKYISELSTQGVYVGLSARF